MKKAIILIIFTCVFLSPAITNAQIDPMIGTTAEWTVAGTLLGVYGGLKFKDRIGFGALYESRTVKFDSRFNENLNFLGLYMDYRILREGKIDVDIFIRGGYSNNRFVVVVPYSKSVKFGCVSWASHLFHSRITQ